MPKRKKPAVKTSPKSEKIPRRAESYPDRNKVFWSFSIYDSGINIPGSRADNVLFSEMANNIKQCELRTWSDIENNQGRDHPITIDKLEKFARKRLTEIGQDDIDELWSIHFNGLFRLWAIRDQSLLKILWIDPDHKICPSIKKHT